MFNLFGLGAFLDLADFLELVVAMLLFFEERHSLRQFLTSFLLFLFAPIHRHRTGSLVASGIHFLIAFSFATIPRRRRGTTIPRVTAAIAIIAFRPTCAHDSSVGVIGVVVVIVRGLGVVGLLAFPGRDGLTSFVVDSLFVRFAFGFRDGQTLVIVLGVVFVLINGVAVIIVPHHATVIRIGVSVVGIFGG